MQLRGFTLMDSSDYRDRVTCVSWRRTFLQSPATIFQLKFFLKSSLTLQVTTIEDCFCSCSRNTSLCFSRSPLLRLWASRCHALFISPLSPPLYGGFSTLLLFRWELNPFALILLCTVLLQMRQARRLSNPCIQRYTSRIGECSSTYVSLSKSPLSSPFSVYPSPPPLTDWPPFFNRSSCEQIRQFCSSDAACFFPPQSTSYTPMYGCDDAISPSTPSSSLLILFLRFPLLHCHTQLFWKFPLLFVFTFAAKQTWDQENAL